jgi:hypothetical protein
LNQLSPLAKLIRIVAFAATAISMSIAASYDIRMRTNPNLLTLLDLYGRINLSVIGNSDGHSIAIHFVNFNPPVHGGYAQNIYFLSSYVLWPQRDYVGPPGVVINDGYQLLDANAKMPDEAWLAQHDVVGQLFMTPKAKLGDFDSAWLPMNTTSAPSQ